jgi:thiol:disulfide interchange protein DsbA
MKRRDFSRTLAGAGVGLALAGGAQAQGGPVEGRDYVRLSTPAPVTLPTADKKVEVLEFFWYGCPHCNAFEPALEAWIKRLPSDVSFRRVHVGFAVPHQTHQKIYYTLERMGLLDTLHRRVFAAMHLQNQRLLNEKDIVAWAVANGVNGDEFSAMFRSMVIDSKARQARSLTDAYKIDGVPAIGVQGRFFTSGTLAGSHERVLAVTDFLIQRSRQNA